MGLLDDAIREHIELKRAHGADAAEVARLERDAFGPATAAPQPLEIGGDAAREPVDPGLLEPQVDAPDPDAGAYAFDEPAPEPEGRLTRLPEPNPAPDPEPVAEPEPEPQAAPPAVWDDPAARTRPFSAEEVAEAQSAAGEVELDEDADSEDVLEETPEFLQETPEHDRLWFEQRPPRDFDFDG
jgi:hypothetical protein